MVAAKRATTTADPHRGDETPQGRVRREADGNRPRPWERSR